MEHAFGIIFVGGLVFLAHVFESLYNRTRIPDVLLLILVGIAVGPGLGLITPETFGAVGPLFTTITLVVILFDGGIDLHLRDLLLIRTVVVES